MSKMLVSLKRRDNLLGSCFKVDFMIASDFFILIRPNILGGVSEPTPDQKTLAGG